MRTNLRRIALRGMDILLLVARDSTGFRASLAMRVPVVAGETVVAAG
ncbi:hypothetical protein GCM10011504_05130 [Siccirubricoccus deserti]|uniref:Uncharacterized protein n=1 Tax=Siccirubricoccus deserti TaxID=2013562 RepID=A0A9X0QUE9_9PROT|nr:hypothetical protein [Siccirubricoccus deserti]MBC4013836.1 hypothetical protein [Siccirubricoccus deserti]GGC29882.1 hypothetical protein GCM10011504_05130 [Siccirubricoccus deserti]